MKGGSGGDAEEEGEDEAGGRGWERRRSTPPQTAPTDDAQLGGSDPTPSKKRPGEQKGAMALAEDESWGGRRRLSAVGRSPKNGRSEDLIDPGHGRLSEESRGERRLVPSPPRRSWSLSAGSLPRPPLFFRRRHSKHASGNPRRVETSFRSGLLSSPPSLGGPVRRKAREGDSAPASTGKADVGGLRIGGLLQRKRGTRTGGPGGNLRSRAPPEPWLPLLARSLRDTNSADP